MSDESKPEEPDLETLQDSQGREVDDEYVDRAVEDAVMRMAEDRGWVHPEPGTTVGDMAAYRGDAGEFKVGMLVELEGFPKPLLVGDVNPLFGDCDDCMGAPRGTVVIRYKQVWSPSGALT
jgi:hypothetical protein